MHLEPALDKLEYATTETRNTDTLFNIYREWAMMNLTRRKTRFTQAADVAGMVNWNTNMEFRSASIIAPLANRSERNN